VIDVDVARVQCAQLKTAADGSPVPQLKAWLRALAREWEHAAEDVEGIGGSIEFVGSIAPGQQVFFTNGYATDFMTVVRNVRDNCLQLSDPNDARPVYLNRMSNVSPVVTRA